MTVENAKHILEKIDEQRNNIVTRVDGVPGQAAPLLAQ